MVNRRTGDREDLDMEDLQASSGLSPSSMNDGAWASPAVQPPHPPLAASSKQFPPELPQHAGPSSGGPVLELPSVEAPKRRRPSINAKVGGETEGQTAHKDEKTGHQLFGDNRGDAEVTSGKPQVIEPSPPLGFMPIWSSKGGVTIARLTHGVCREYC